MPGTAELQSLATLEALAASTPTLAADAMALPHLVQHGKNGFLHRPGDIADMTASLAVLLGDTELRRRMGVRSRQIVAEHSMERTLLRFEELYAQTPSRPVRSERQLLQV